MSEPPISRGFRSRRQEQTPKTRLPPGQYVTTDFPVLSAGPTPQIKVENWTFTLLLGGAILGTWKWAEFENVLTMVCGSVVARQDQPLSINRQRSRPAMRYQASTI